MYETETERSCRQWLLVGVLACGVILCVCMIARPLLRGDAAAAGQAGNRYIEADYAGWQDVTVDGIGSFKLPGAWSMAQTDGDYEITYASSYDGTQVQLAVGKCMEIGDDRGAGLISEVLGFDVQEISTSYRAARAYAPYTAAEYSTARGQSKKMNFWELTLGNEDGSMSLVFVFPEGSVKDTALEAILEAVISSFVPGRLN